MTFSSIIRTLGRSPLATELLNKLKRNRCLQLSGIARLPKGLIASALAQQEGRPLLVVTATLEEAGRWVAQLEAMGWQAVHFYPTSEASPYELSYSDESEMTWGQMQVLADLLEDAETESKPIAIVATERALQPHLPPPAEFAPYCLTLQRGAVQDSKSFDRQLVSMGYDRVSLVEMEGQWSRRGDIVDVFPVAAELPVRLEWFGDDLEQIREFDPSSQRSLDKIDRLVLTPTDFGGIVRAALSDRNLINREGAKGAKEEGEEEGEKKVIKWLLGLAFDRPAAILDYLPSNTLVVVDEPGQCEAHSNRWFENAQEQWEVCDRELKQKDFSLLASSDSLPKIHRSFADSMEVLARFDRLEVSELVEASAPSNAAVNLASRPLPVMPHQFAKLAQMLREERDRGFTVFLVSAQPSRSVSLLSEHDCPGDRQVAIAENSRSFEVQRAGGIGRFYPADFSDSCH